MIDRSKVLEFATRKHLGQKRKDGKDYITHPIAVAEIALKIFDEEYVYTPDPSNDEDRDILYALSILHDTYEDTDTTLEELEREFGGFISAAVGLLSRAEGVTYFQFIWDLYNKGELLTIITKRADLEHNMSDLKEGSLKDKYRFAEQILKDW
jgi:(p)ppGpp synthase/HD superfamily hydrolase